MRVTREISETTTMPAMKAAETAMSSGFSTTLAPSGPGNPISLCELLSGAAVLHFPATSA